MKKRLSFLIFLTIFLTVTPVSADIKNNLHIYSNTGNRRSNINTNIDITNNLGNANNSSSYSETNVSMEHSGDGNSKSEVTINGKTYTLEGPGSIKVENNNAIKVIPISEEEISPTPSSTKDVLGTSDFANKDTDKRINLINTLISLLLRFFKNLLNP